MSSIHCLQATSAIHPSCGEPVQVFTLVPDDLLSSRDAMLGFVQVANEAYRNFCRQHRLIPQSTVFTWEFRPDCPGFGENGQPLWCWEDDSHAAGMERIFQQRQAVQWLSEATT